MTEFERWYRIFNDQLLKSDPVHTGEWHAQDVSKMPLLDTYELTHESFILKIPDDYEDLQTLVSPNLPWAEDHFMERVSGQPLNPPPSHEWWPYGNTKTHQKGETFSHTYPERFWPKFANEGGKCADSERVIAVPHVGIRYEYGDLQDVIQLLVKSPLTRQAYLPVWFPEDTGGHVRTGDRVPCTLGYHFLVRNNTIDISYFIRSVDFIRHFRDDVYMAGRLLQYVCAFVNYHHRAEWVADGYDEDLFTPMKMGHLRMTMSSLHAMVGDRPKMEEYSNGPR